MSAMWHDHGFPSFLGIAPSFSFHELPEVHMKVEIAAPCYTEAMVEMSEREQLLGAVWSQHNGELAHAFYERKKPWWLF